MRDEIEYKGYRIVIDQDDCHESPDAWGDDEVFLGEIKTSRYQLGRANYTKTDGQGYLPWGTGVWCQEPWGEVIPAESWLEDTMGQEERDWAEAREKYEEWEYQQQVHQRTKELYWVFPVCLRDYGGGNIRLVEGDAEDEESYDGWVYVKKQPTAMSLLAEVLTGELPQARFESLLEIWNQYCEGDVWSFRIYRQGDEDGEEGEVVDSCGGYYGYEYAMAEAKACVDWQVRQAETKCVSNQEKEVVHV